MTKSQPVGESLLYGLDQGAGAELLPEVAAAFERLRLAAAREGIDLAIASGRRNFARQLAIWNRKAAGLLPVLDDQGCVLDMACLPDCGKVNAILRWSALPGASRHHWGTDCDVYDRAAVAPGYQLQLTREEAGQQFARLHRWLDQRIERGEAEGFYRPYDQDRGGIAPEPWHLSHAATARSYEQAFSVERLGDILRESDLALKDAVLPRLPELYRRFIRVPAPGPG